MAITTTITALPTAPSRSDSANFDTRADVFLTAIESVPTEINAWSTEANALATTVNSDSIIASTAASTALTANNATTWVSGTTYALHDIVISPTDNLFYIRIIAGAGTTDPSADATNWSKLSLTDIVNDTSPRLGGDLDSNGNRILKSAYTQIADASLGTGTHIFDYSAGDMQQLTATGSIALATSNFVSGAVCSMVIDAINFGAYTIAHPTTWLFAEGTAPIYTVTGTDRLLLLKDKDDVYSLHVVGQDIKAV